MGRWMRRVPHLIRIRATLSLPRVLLRLLARHVPRLQRRVQLAAGGLELHAEGGGALRAVGLRVERRVLHLGGERRDAPLQLHRAALRVLGGALGAAGLAPAVVAPTAGVLARRLLALDLLL